MKFLLLPGMDGTGLLFEPFIKLAPKTHDIEAVSLIQKPDISYEEQARDISLKIHSPTVIIAESYSGMIALELLQKYPANIVSVIFVASFIERPSFLSKFADFIPKHLLNLSVKINNVSSFFLFGKWRSENLNNLFNLAMQQVSTQTLKHRLTQISQLEAPSYQFKCNCLYLKASNDVLVSGDASKAFELVFDDIEIEIVNGTHFLLQTNPRECWEKIKQSLGLKN